MPWSATRDMPTLLILFVQSKADEIAKLMNENERLKSTIEDLKVGMKP